MLPVTSIFAAILAVFYVFLAFQVIKRRGVVKVGVGDGGDKTLQHAIRAHGNFAEYVPFALLIIALLENSGAASWLVCALASALVLGRVLHSYSMLVTELREPSSYRCRVVGMMITFGVFILAALSLVISVL